MTELHFPFLETAVLVPLAGAAAVAFARDAVRRQRLAQVASAAALLLAVCAWQDFAVVHSGDAHPAAAHDRWDLLASLAHHEVFVVDELTAPLLPTVALLYFLTILTTQRTKAPRFPFDLALLSEACALALFACRGPWAVIALLALGAVPTYVELRRRGRPTRVYALHMAASVALIGLGWTLVELDGERRFHSLWVLGPLLVGVLIRGGLAPFHLWVADLFEHATFGTALLFVAPMTGAYAAVRLVIPVAADWVLQGMGLVAILTAVYAAAMTLVQREARRFFCYLFLSHSALVFVGLEMATPLGLTGGLLVWLSVGVALGGLGLTLRAVEARCGRLSLDDFHGLYEHTPALAVCFAIAGLAGVGFPGTLGFVGTEMLIDGAVTTYPHVGVALLAATALNGVAILRAYFLLFTGTRRPSRVSLRVGGRERFAVVALAGLLVGGGLYPQPGVASRHEAAERVLRDRGATPSYAVRPRPDGTTAAADAAAVPNGNR